VDLLRAEIETVKVAGEKNANLSARPPVLRTTGMAPYLIEYSCKANTDFIRFMTEITTTILGFEAHGSIRNSHAYHINYLNHQIDILRIEEAVE
jgi:hypothetical protein